MLLVSFLLGLLLGALFTYVALRLRRWKRYARYYYHKSANFFSFDRV
jgi:hypothetical protein